MDFLVRWSATFDDQLTSIFLGPAYNLANIDNLTGFVIAWGILALYYFLLYYKLELRFWNSVNGYIDSRRSALFAIIFYYLTSMVLIGILHGPLLAQKKKLARRWARGSVKPPAWLQGALEDLTE